MCRTWLSNDKDKGRFHCLQHLHYFGNFLYRLKLVQIVLHIMERCVFSGFACKDKSNIN